MTVGAVLKTKDKSVVSVKPSASVQEVAEIITSRRIGAVLVLDENGGVAGIVSERDVVKALAANAGSVDGLRADALMTRAVITTTSQTTIDEALQEMLAAGVRIVGYADNITLV